VDLARLVRARHLTSSLLREPLVHFVVLGTALFLLYARVAPEPAHEIVVPASLVQGLVRDAERRTGRTPTPAEAEAMVERWIDDEVRYREALALGLDRGDLIVRRRLVQKMDFLLAGSTPVPAPTDAELAAWLAAHPDQYAAPDRLSFEHVFAAARPARAPDASQRRACGTGCPRSRPARRRRRSASRFSAATC
jgi:peptidyl-prolyl cis-trans isomerase C